MNIIKDNADDDADGNGDYDDDEGDDGMVMKIMTATIMIFMRIMVTTNSFVFSFK